MVHICGTKTGYASFQKQNLAHIFGKKIEHMLFCFKKKMVHICAKKHTFSGKQKVYHFWYKSVPKKNTAVEPKLAFFGLTKKSRFSRPIFDPI